MICVYCNDDLSVKNTMVGAGDGRGQRYAHKVCYDLVQLGRESETNITGLPSECVINVEMAFKAIKSELKLGQQCHHGLEKLRAELRGLVQKV